MSLPVGPVNEQYQIVTGSGPLPLNLAEYERYCKHVLPRNAHDYYASGSDDMITLRQNRASYQELVIVPRILRDVSRIDTATTVLGCKISFPVCIAPTAMQRMAHPDGETATARAAFKNNILMGLSSLSTTSLEDVAKAAPGGMRWFQLYIYKDRSVTLDLVRRAEKAGYLALAVTVDTPKLGRREADLRNRFELPPHLKMANFTSIGGKHTSGVVTGGAAESGLANYVSSLIDPSLTWHEIQWLRTQTKLKIVVKGVLAPEDAVDAVANHVDAIWVSNHGARQLDTSPATIDVLPEIVQAVEGSGVEIYVDGGILRGTDVFKALALGAKAVFIGRPVLWGLAHSGEAGVNHVVSLLREEFIQAMRLAGCMTIEDIKPSFIRHQRTFHSRL